MKFANTSLASLRSALDARQVSATELAEYFLVRIEKAVSLNTFLHVDRRLTLLQAQEADARIGRGDAGALTGIPIAHKDIFVTKGWRSTAGSKMLADYQSPFDATVVEKLGTGLPSSAGMVCLGKLNCDEFAMGSSNENSAFGPVQNPWNPQRIPGAPRVARRRPSRRA